MRRFTGFLSAGLLAAAAACSAPTPPGGGSGGAGGGPSIVIGTGSEPDDLNPILGYAPDGASKIFDGLRWHYARATSSATR